MIKSFHYFSMLCYRSFIVSINFNRKYSYTFIGIVFLFNQVEKYNFVLNLIEN